jgi:hypothetical protein
MREYIGLSVQNQMKLHWEEISPETAAVFRSLGGREPGIAIPHNCSRYDRGEANCETLCRLEKTLGWCIVERLSAQ